MFLFQRSTKIRLVSDNESAGGGTDLPRICPDVENVTGTTGTPVGWVKCLAENMQGKVTQNFV